MCSRALRTNPRPKPAIKKRQRPLHLRGVIAKPEQSEGDDHRRRRRRQSEPRQPALVGDPVPQLLDGFFHPRNSAWIRFFRGAHAPSRAVAGALAGRSFLLEEAKSIRLRRRHERFAAATARQLESILLQPAIERAPTQSQSLRRLPRVAIEARKRLLDQERFHFLEAHVFEPRRIGKSTR